MVGLSAAELARELGDGRGCPIAGGFRVPCVLAGEHQNGDRDPSLTITERNGKILVYCRSRHSNEQDRVIEALRARGLWYEANTNGKSGARRVPVLA
jgi:hypothetical protein